MPAGKIKYKCGREEWYDDIEYHGGKAVIKTAYDHNVKTARLDNITVQPGEWHRTPFGWCKNLSRNEVNQALKKGHGRCKH